MYLRRGLALFTLLAAGSACTASDDESDHTDLVSGSDVQALARRGQPSAEDAFTAFESGQVRPLALSPAGDYLYAVNTPDNRLEIFHNRRGALTPVGSVVVGLEPVAVAA